MARLKAVYLRSGVFSGVTRSEKAAMTRFRSCRTVVTVIPNFRSQHELL
jgi:hypothetical protein